MSKYLGNEFIIARTPDDALSEYNGYGETKGMLKVGDRTHEDPLDIDWIEDYHCYSLPYQEEQYSNENPDNIYLSKTTTEKIRALVLLSWRLVSNGISVSTIRKEFSKIKIWTEIFNNQKFDN